jgi:nicotinate-nucleotide adenylyltransferase
MIHCAVDRDMRLGIFGGTFDPVHYGHLLLAECCREQARLDEVWFMPAATPPHKIDRAPTPADKRIEMLDLAIGGHEAFRVSRIEINRGGVSYTVDTLAAVGEAQPGAELFFLLGGDSLDEFTTWREPGRICELATPLVVGRAQSPEPNYDALSKLVGHERTKAIRLQQVQMPQIELSSSDLRRRVGEGLSIRYRTPRAVEKYIESAGLYRASG